LRDPGRAIWALDDISPCASTTGSAQARAGHPVRAAPSHASACTDKYDTHAVAVPPEAVPRPTGDPFLRLPRRRMATAGSKQDGRRALAA